MSQIPEGYEPESHSFAKNVAMDALERELENQDIDPYGDDDAGEPNIDLIGLSDAVVEALLLAGIVIPEDIKNPHGLQK